MGSQMSPGSQPPPQLVTTSTLAVSVMLPVLGTIAVALRFYAKSLRSHKPSLDDWVTVLAQLCSWGISINTFVTSGLAGIDSTKLDPFSAGVISFRATWILGFPLIASLVLVKIAILMFYATIFITPVFRFAVWVYIGILTAWGIASCVTHLLAADPITSLLGPLNTPFRYNYSAFNLAFSSMGLAFDVIVLCFPLPIIRKLRMPWKLKLQVIGIFWLGIFCCIASAIRLRYSYSSLVVKINESGLPTADYTMIIKAFLWAMVEPNVSIVAACVPTYGPLFSSGQDIRSTAQEDNGTRQLLNRSGSSRGSAQTSTNNVPLRLTDSQQQYWRHLGGSNHYYTIDTQTAASTYDGPVAPSTNAY